MLRLEHLRKDYGGQRVLDDASLVLKPGERAALVAPNGAGKSTLLKITAGLEHSDAGRVSLPPGTVVGYLAQDAGVQPGRSLHDEVLSAVADLLAIEESMRALEHQMSGEGEEHQASAAGEEHQASAAGEEHQASAAGEEHQASAAGPGQQSSEAAGAGQRTSEAPGAGQRTSEAPGAGHQSSEAAGPGQQTSEAADHDRLDALVHQHAQLQEDFERRGGYAIEAEIGRVLSGLGFTETDRARQTQEFSGGWQMRIALARLLLGRPDVLLLDEPTNHLDLAATEWLEEYVKASRATMLIVSHDRYFLDSVVQRVFELRQGRIEAFPPGNYSAYRTERARRDEALQDIAQRQQEEIERVEAYIRRYKEGNRATMAKSREKMLARLEAQRVAAPRADRVVKFTFPACPPSGREVITLSHVRRAYAERTVLEDVTLVIERGERVALIGPNGAGKSTLLRLLAGKDRPTRGSASLGVGVRPAYFAQDQAEHLDPANTIFDEVYQAAPASWDVQAVRDLLGRFLFSGEDQFKSVATLSGGERSRVALAKLLLRANNLLLLDEPTNHLDIATRERLEDTLSGYQGTLVVATHDRYLVNRLATKVIEVADRGIHAYVGTYADYLRAKAAAAAAAVTVDAAPRPSTASRADQDPAARRRLAAELREAERQVTVAEDRLRAVEAALSDPANYAGDLASLAHEHAALREQVETLTARWAELAEAAEGAA